MPRTRSAPKPIAISDSANFYVSAERLFDPTLKGVPVIVLSNNDGCAIARSDDYVELQVDVFRQPILVERRRWNVSHHLWTHSPAAATFARSSGRAGWA